MEIDESEKIQTILCDTLHRIGSVCTKELEECFSTEDLVRTTKSHLLEMQKFLLSFAEGKISEDELVGCGVVQVIESENSEVVINDDAEVEEENELEREDSEAVTNYDTYGEEENGLESEDSEAVINEDSYDEEINF
eukprot:TRINITY_DN11638_c0_g1_i1.p2 TRINITY_DN11638_c0_g1~~TRINITY_DN11638_c0_g1_i1.p2  ORF type:complete len:137 (+),score=53.89 TRINITY_DN11638_c0_g1_i1:629-1039(+)